MDRNTTSSLPTTRRRFLKAAATVTAFNIIPRHVLGGPGHVPPSEKVNIAFVGVGGKGTQNLHRVFAEADAQVIAIADPASHFSLEGTYYGGVGGRDPARELIETHYKKKTPNFHCAVYEDFRIMLEKERSVDAIVCSTPDHTHAIVSVHAMRSGKHVYCEKPLTHNIWEAREVARISRETGLATQMGNQGHSTNGIRETVEWLQAGVIGAVREIQVWTAAKRWNPALTTRPTGSVPVPAGLNWDLWLGPCESRDFHPAYFPVAWRDFWAFGGSGIGDFGCHDFDAATWAFDLPVPARIEAFGAGPMDQEIAPHGCTVHYEFPARGRQPAIKLTYRDGGLKPPAPDALERFPLPRRGILFLGDKGAIECDGAGGAPRLFPHSLRASFVKPAPTLARSGGHFREWLDACKGGAPAAANFTYGAHLTEIALLGVLALRTGRRIDWNAEAMRAVGFPEADSIIREPSRNGWLIA